MPPSMMHFTGRSILCRLGLLCGLLGLAGHAVAAPPRPLVPLVKDASDEFFAKGEIPQLRFEISDAELEKLRAEPRSYVKATLTENGKTVYNDVALKLKGAAGSFRDFDDKPALTLNVDKHVPGQTFHALKKFHLNNSVQDESYLNELLCAELFQQTGIPAARVTHARVWLNGRDVGLYVFKESFDKLFLKRYFPDATGNLYDGGFVQDVNVDLEKDTGDGPDDHSDLHELAAACEEPDLELRYRKVAELVDLDTFYTFMALERMTCHWDGYCLCANNYRLYFDPAKKQWVFFPHGMDQMFGELEMPLFDLPNPLVSRTILQHKPWRDAYRERVRQLLPMFVPADRLVARADQVARRLQPVLKALDPDLAAAHQERVRELKERLSVRAEHLQRLVDEPEPGPLEFNAQGTAKLAGWYSAAEVEDAQHEAVEQPAGQPALLIAAGAGESCIASWRSTVLLGPGRYKFVGQARCRDVVPLKEERTSGVGIRVSQMERTSQLIGTTAWTPLEFEFTVTEELKQVELVAELRASRGKVWFQADAFELRKVPETDR